MSRIMVDSDEILQAQSQMTATMARMRADSDSINAFLQHLSTTWNGAASASFQTTFSDWRGTQTQLHESFDNISQVLGRAGNQYAEVEQSNARMFAR